MGVASHHQQQCTIQTASSQLFTQTPDFTVSLSQHLSTFLQPRNENESHSLSQTKPPAQRIQQRHWPLFLSLRNFVLQGQHSEQIMLLALWLHQTTPHYINSPLHSPAPAQRHQNVYEGYGERTRMKLLNRPSMARNEGRQKASKGSKGCRESVPRAEQDR
jgi:hypothetical protein